MVTAEPNTCKEPEGEAWLVRLGKREEEGTAVERYIQNSGCDNRRTILQDPVRQKHVHFPRVLQRPPKKCGRETIYGCEAFVRSLI